MSYDTVKPPSNGCFVEVQSLGDGGSYQITALLTPSQPPFQNVSSEFPGYAPIAVGDFNGDGVPELVAPDGIHLGLGDGTFSNVVSGGPLAQDGWSATAIAVGNFSDDGLPDIAVAEISPDGSTADVRVLQDVGSGQLQVVDTFAVDSQPVAIQVIDFGNGIEDLAVADYTTGNVAIFVGDGKGGFSPGPILAGGSQPSALAAGRLGDGHVDLIVADQGDPSTGNGQGLRVFQGDGPGQFLLSETIAVGSAPSAVVVADLTGDGFLDLAVAEANSDQVSVLLNKGNGTFMAPVSYSVGQLPLSLVAVDFGNGHIDLATANENSDDVSVLLGNGDGTFEPQSRFGAGSSPGGLVAADFTGDGRTDLAVANLGSSDISVLLGRGDGTFQDQLINPVGSDPSGAVTADLNNDGHIDIITSNYSSNHISVLLGNGDGTFEAARFFAAGNRPTALAVGDFNGDGLLDVAVADAGINGVGQGVSILLGNGDGTFQAPVFYPAGTYPESIVAGDFTDNGVLDLAVANQGSGHVSILLGDGRGGFSGAITIPLLDPGAEPISMVAGDFTGDGQLELAVLDRTNNEVSILGSDVRGEFHVLSQISLTVPQGFPIALAAGDFNGNGVDDLAVVSEGSDGSDFVSVMLGMASGTFDLLTPIFIGTGLAPTSIIAAHLVGGSPLDLAIADSGSQSVSLLQGDGRGGFNVLPALQLGSDGSPQAVAAGDFTGDGRSDLAIAQQSPNSLTIELSQGDGQFSQAGSGGLVPQNTPLVADLNGDGVPDLSIVDGAGNILYRQGIPGQPGTFEPPVMVNPGNPSRDIAWVPDTDQGPVLASVDAHDNKISLYAYRDGGLVLVGGWQTGNLPAQIIAADLNGDGLTDLVVRNAGDGTLSVFFGTEFVGPINPKFVTPQFSPPVTIPVGLGVSDVEVVDTTGSGRLDLVVTNKLTGQIGILQNLGNGTFGPLEPYRAGTGLSAIDTSSGSRVVTSEEATAGVAAGPLTPGGPTDLVTINPGSNTLDILDGLGGGRFANPMTVQTQQPAQVIRMADLITGDGIEDLVLLGTNQVSIMLGNGHGGFEAPVTYPAGLDPTGLTVADLNGDGIPDLLIGNAYGDVLILQGNGDGTFRPFHEADQAVELAVANLTGNGKPDFIYADQGLDRVVVQYGSDQTTVLGDQATGLLSPGAVKLADLNGDGIPDLIVANSGSNNVLVYPGLGNGQFGPALNGGHGFFVGTNPTGITVANLNGQPDLIVANSGSNDVSILLGQGSGSNWTLVPGPRIQTDAGPVAVAVGNILGTGEADLAVANKQANNVQVFPGVGGGFFSQNATTYAVGQAPDGLFLGDFSGSGTQIATLNAGSNTISLINPNSGGVIQTIPTGGVLPTSGFAVNGSRFTILVVGNTADGRISYFQGGAGGLSLSQTITSDEVPSPTSLSLAGLSDGVLSFYAATTGREAVSLLAFNLNQQQGSDTGSDTGALSGQTLAGTTGQSTGAVLSAATTGVFQQVGLLLGSGSSVFDLIAPLFTVSVIPGETAVEPAGEGGVALLASFTPSITPGLPVGQSLRLDSHGSSGETGDGKPPPKEQAETTAIEEGPTLPLWARIAIGLDRSFEQARADLLKKAGVGETAADRQQPARPEIRNKADMAPATPQPGEHARPTKTSFHAVIDAAIEQLAAVSDLWRQVLPGESEPGDGDVVTAITAPRLFPPIAAAALASAAALAGKWPVNRIRRNPGVGKASRLKVV